MISHVYCENCIKALASWKFLAFNLREALRMRNAFEIFLMHKKFSSLENDLYSLSHEKNYISYYGRRSSLNFKIYVKERKREKKCRKRLCKELLLEGQDV